MNTLTESMTRMQSSGYTVRIWREEEAPNKIAGKSELHAHFRELCEQQYRQDNTTYASYIATELLKLPKVNAVEVLVDGGDGLVVYKNWP